MHVGNHDQAIQYLQRAINVEPRNPLNWHYLAQNYWSRGDFEQCREMVNRSRAYSRLDPDLERANRALAMQCGCEQNGGCQ
jgi:predicted Zn-dependent protease